MLRKRVPGYGRLPPGKRIPKVSFTRWTGLHPGKNRHPIFLFPDLTTVGVNPFTYPRTFERFSNESQPFRWKNVRIGPCEQHLFATGSRVNAFCICIGAPCAP